MSALLISPAFWLDAMVAASILSIAALCALDTGRQRP